MPPALIRLKNPLIYPGDRRPGFDSTHPAAKSVNLSAVAINTKTMARLDAGLPAVIGTAPDLNIIYPGIGPGIGYGGAGLQGQFYFPLNYSGISLPFTSAMIFQNYGSGNNSIISSLGSGTTQTQQIFRVSTVPALLAISPSFNISFNVPYFVAATANASVVNAILVDLRTGRITTATSGGIATPGSSPNLYLCNPNNTARAQNGTIAATMFASTFLSMAQLVAWAADVWSFWYPPRVEQILVSGLGRGPNVVSATAAASGIGASNAVATVPAFMPTGPSEYPLTPGRPPIQQSVTFNLLDLALRRAIPLMPGPNEYPLTPAPLPPTPSWAWRHTHMLPPGLPPGDQLYELPFRLRARLEQTTALNLLESTLRTLVSAATAAASGQGAASATSQAIWQATAAAAGIGSSNVIGAGLFGATTSAAGTGAATATGQEIAAATASAAGVGAASAVANGIATATASATGLGAAAATSQAIKGATAAAAGTGVALATGAQTAQATAAAAGTGIASGVGQFFAQATAAASGVGAASATGRSIQATVVTAAGIGAAVAQGVDAAGGVSAFASPGIGTAQATSQAIWQVTAASAGFGAATGEGRALKPMIGQAAGIGAANSIGVGVTIASGAGVAPGTGAASATCQAIWQSTSTATGSGVALATGAGINQAIAHQALGVGTAAAVGLALAIESATAAASGVGSATAAGARVFASAGLSTGHGVALGNAQILNTAIAQASGIGAALSTSQEIGTALALAYGIGDALGIGGAIASSIAHADAAGQANAITTNAAFDDQICELRATMAIGDFGATMTTDQMTATMTVGNLGAMMTINQLMATMAVGDIRTSVRCH